MGWCAFLLGIGVVVFAIAVTCHSYIPCPFWDEWVVVADIGSGKGPTHLAWLWSQQNEHRLAIPRLLVWLDLVAFHGRNVSLFIEILGVQVLHWAALCFVVERFTRAPVSVKRSIQGLFGFCLFHPNQLENFTWAFQIGFVLPFALANVSSDSYGVLFPMEASGISGHHSWRDADPRSAEPCRRLSDRARGRWNRLVQTDAGVGGCDAYGDLVRKRRRISVWISPRRDGFTALRSYFAGKEAVPLRTYLFRRKLDAPAATQGTAHRFRIDLNIRRDPWQGAAPAPGGASRIWNGCSSANAD